MPIEDEAAQDPREPRADALGISEAREGGEALDVGLLDEVLGVLRRTSEPHREAVDVGEMRKREGLETAPDLVAFERKLDAERRGHRVRPVLHGRNDPVS